MKTTKLFSLILAAGLAGVALVKFGNANFLAALPGDKLFAFAASVALVGFAAYDYSRRHPPLSPRIPLLRPSLPASAAPRPAAFGAARRRPVGERTAA